MDIDETPPLAVMDMDDPIPTKYIYVSGHLYLELGMPYITSIPNVSFANTVEPDALCHEHPLA